MPSIISEICHEDLMRECLRCVLVHGRCSVKVEGFSFLNSYQISDSHTCSSYVLMKTVYVTGPNKQRLYTIIVMNSYFRYD